jgi:hypothetical protein
MTKIKGQIRELERLIEQIVKEREPFGIAPDRLQNWVSNQATECVHQKHYAEALSNALDRGMYHTQAPRMVFNYKERKNEIKQFEVYRWKVKGKK